VILGLFSRPDPSAHLSCLRVVRQIGLRKSPTRPLPSEDVTGEETMDADWDEVKTLSRTCDTHTSCSSKKTRRSQPLQVGRVPFPPPGATEFPRPPTTIAFDTCQELLWTGNDRVCLSHRSPSGHAHGLLTSSRLGTRPLTLRQRTATLHLVQDTPFRRWTCTATPLHREGRYRPGPSNRAHGVAPRAAYMEYTVRVVEVCH
jgi:hypothetical protein